MKREKLGEFRHQYALGREGEWGSNPQHTERNCHLAPLVPVTTGSAATSEL